MTTPFVGLEAKLNKIEVDVILGFAKTNGNIETRFAKVDSEINMLKWMMGIIIAGIASLVIKAFLA